MQPVTIDFFARLRTPSNLCILADGTPAFLLKKPNLARNNYDSNLCLLQNGKLVKAAKTPYVNSLWALPSGGAVFSAKPAKVEKGFPLTVLHRLASTGESEEWLQLPYSIGDAVFLSDEKFLFTAEYDPDKEAILAKVGTDKKKAEKLFAELASVEVITRLPVWRNGGGFAARRYNRLYLWQQNEITLLSPEELDIETVRLAPDGSAAFCICSKVLDVSGLKNQLYRLNIGNMELVDISPCSTFNYEEVVPMSAHQAVVYGSDMGEYGMSQNGDFFMLDTAASVFRALTTSGMYCQGNSVGTDCALPAESRWLSVGNTVYFHSTVGDDSAIFKLDVSTGDIERLTHFKGAVLELAVDKSGTLYFTAMQDNTAPEVFCLLAGDCKMMSRINVSACKKAQFSSLTPLTFKNSEGNEIDGWVMPPLQRQDKPCPAILYIHGGPKAVYGQVLFHELQYLASCGFAVMFCNPTGSNGKGNAFADIRGRYGSVDYEDLMTFVDKALHASPWIDKDRLGVAGGSYGGFMVNWITSHSQRFAAAVTERGICNWATMAATSDIGHFFAPDQMAASSSTDYERLWSASPLKYAQNVHTPTLILHSTKDYRCWMADALQWFSALKQAGTQVRMCLFDGESHELSRSGRPQNRVRRLQEIASWFREYL